MNATRGDFDCPNAGCRAYHDLVRRPYHDHQRAPRCPACNGGLRLVRVVRQMPPKVRALLAERRAR